MTAAQSQDEEKQTPRNTKTIVSAVLPDGRLVETLHMPESGTTALAVWDGTRIGIAHELLVGSDRLVPYRGDNPLLTNRVVLFPSAPAEYGDTKTLVAAIAAFIHKYVDLTPAFEKLAVEYVLFTWVYDRFKHAQLGPMNALIVRPDNLPEPNADRGYVRGAEVRSRTKPVSRIVQAHSRHEIIRRAPDL